MISKLLKLTFALLLIATFTSCVTDLKEPLLVIKETKYKESVLVVNGISGLSKNEGVNVFANGSKINETPVTYAKTSEQYVKLLSGTVSFEAKINGVTIATTTKDIEVGKLYSLYLSGTKEAPEMFVREDDINLDDPNSQHSLSIANLSNEVDKGLEMEIFVQGYDELLQMGFHTATGPYGIITVYALVKDIPKVVKYKEVFLSSKFPGSSIIVPFPYRFIEATTNTADITKKPIPQSTGTYFTGQKLTDLFTGKITNTTLFVKNHHTTIVVSGTKKNNDRTTFTYDNTALYKLQ